MRPSFSVRSRVVGGVLLALATGCGPSMRDAHALDEELVSLGLPALRDTAPERAAEATQARDRAVDALSHEDRATFSEESTLARAVVELAVAERERDARRAEVAEADATLAALDAEATTLEDEAHALEITSERALTERAIREELARSLAVAERDEGRPRRRSRVGLDDAEARQATEVLRARARVLVAALAWSGEAELARALTTRLETSPPREDTIGALARVDAVDVEARAALARRLDAQVDPDHAARIEALEADGFTVERAPEGLRVLVPSSTPARLARLAAHLAGPTTTILVIVPRAADAAPIRRALEQASAHSVTVAVEPTRTVPALLWSRVSA